MTSWLQFLLQNGARFGDQPGREQEVSDFAQGARGLDDFVAPLTDLGVIAASGEDAARFLHSQLTNDVEHLQDGQARLAGYCSAKGRLLATLLLWKRGDTVFLQLPREIQAAVQKRLQMFILRSKVKLSDAAAGKAILGLVGEPAVAALSNYYPELPEAPYSAVHAAAGTLIRLADTAGAPRYQWIMDEAMAQEAWPELLKHLAPAPARLWRLTEIHAGIPRITAATQEKFVPHMVNFELVGGVSFKKGCYPGQEVVARSQYLGKLKRRMLVASIATQQEVLPGMEVFAKDDPDQPCGMIVNAERNLGTGVHCLVEMKTAALEQGEVHLGSAQGPVLTFGELPYPLPA